MFFAEVQTATHCDVVEFVDVAFAATALYIQEARHGRLSSRFWPHILAAHVRLQDRQCADELCSVACRAPMY